MSGNFEYFDSQRFVREHIFYNKLGIKGTNMIGLFILSGHIGIRGWLNTV